MLTFDDTANELEISGGNVGIGTTSPASLLHLASASTSGTLLRLTNSDTGGTTFLLGSTGSANAAGAGKLIIGNATTDFIGVTNGGFVGIGTTSPAAKLHVSGTQASDGAAIRLTNTTATVGKTYKVISKDDGTAEIIAVGSPDKVVARMGVK